VLSDPSCRGEVILDPGIHWARGLGGAPLTGGKIMRLVYLDEAGISNPAHEPHLVVAGVIVDADRKWKELETYLRQLAISTFPDRDPYRFVFHAKDIWHGNGVFDRKKWRLQDRLKSLQQLAQIPRLFDLPIVAGCIDREAMRKEVLKRYPTMSAKAIRSITHTQAFLVAVQCVEYWMETKASDEVAMLIAEDTDQVKEAIQRFHDGYTDPAFDNSDAFRSKYIIDAVNFAKKQNSLLLQIADHCAFIIKRKLMERQHADQLYNQIHSQINWQYRETKSYALRVRLSEIRRLPPDAA
jgi:Protein of unknown function (DUF3800)